MLVPTEQEDRRLQGNTSLATQILQRKISCRAQSIVRRNASHAQHAMHSNYTDTMTPHCEFRRLMEIQVIADQLIKRRMSSKVQLLDPTASAITHLRDHPREYATTAQTIKGWADH
jgi:hypothetical protein